MLYFTGDIHGDINRFCRLGEERQYTLGAEDYLVVCGDFGFLFYPQGTMGYLQQQNELDELATLPYTILWVDGNHENFDLLETYPRETWHGGRIHRIRKNVFHLMRGEVYDIDGVKLFSMGGAYSIDKYMRTEGLSWWARELPSNDEYRTATQSLHEVKHSVDVIVSHTAPREVIMRMGYRFDVHDAELTGFLEWVMHEVKYKRWYFGHWHADTALEPRMQATYREVYPYQK